MKIGNLVRHKGTGAYYIIQSVDESSLVGVMISGELKYVHKEWLEVIDEDR